MKAYPDKAILDRAWARFRAGGHKTTSFNEEGGVIPWCAPGVASA